MAHKVRTDKAAGTGDEELHGEVKVQVKVEMEEQVEVERCGEEEVEVEVEVCGQVEASGQVEVQEEVEAKDSEFFMSFCNFSFAFTFASTFMSISVCASTFLEGQDHSVDVIVDAGEPLCKRFGGLRVEVADSFAVFEMALGFGDGASCDVVEVDLVQGVVPAECFGDVGRDTERSPTDLGSEAVVFLAGQLVGQGEDLLGDLHCFLPDGHVAEGSEARLHFR